MATPERPKSRLPDGRINPEYTDWRKEHVLKSASLERGVATKEMYDQPVCQGTPPGPMFSAAPHNEASIPKADILTLRCVKLARNTTFVYCALGDGIVGVKVKRGIGPKLLKKTIKVRNEGETYVHVP